MNENWHRFDFKIEIKADDRIDSTSNTIISNAMLQQFLQLHWQLQQAKMTLIYEYVSNDQNRGLNVSVVLFLMLFLFDPIKYANSIRGWKIFNACESKSDRISVEISLTFNRFGG